MQRGKYGRRVVIVTSVVAVRKQQSNSEFQKSGTAPKWPKNRRLTSSTTRICGDGRVYNNQVVWMVGVFQRRARRPPWGPTQTAYPGTLSILCGGSGYRHLFGEFDIDLGRCHFGDPSQASQGLVEDASRRGTATLLRRRLQRPRAIVED